MAPTNSQRVGLLGGGLLAAVLTCSSASSAQSLGDLARQERERRKEMHDHAAHVYTNDDLTRSQILLPEDRERALAALENQSQSAPIVAAVSSDPNSAPPVPQQSAPEIPFLADITRKPIFIEVPEFELATVRPVIKPGRRLKNIEPPGIAAARPAHLPIASRQPTVAQEMKSAAPLRVLSEATAKPTAVRHSSEADDLRRAIEAAEARHGVDVIEPRHAVESIESRHAAEPASLQTERATVRVERGDSLWKLSKFYLGSGARWKELVALNPEVTNPNVIHTGERIRLS